MALAKQIIEADMRCGECPIRHNAVCAYCGASDLVKLDAIKSYRDYKPGETVIWAGERLTMVGSVVQGVASLTRTLADGRRQMVGLLLPSDFMGRPGRDIAPFDVVAATDLKVCSFQKKQFDDLMAATPALERRLLEMTLDELDSAREWMLLLGRKTAREKIASFLALIARRDAAIRKSTPGDGLHFALPLTREAMADYLGLTIETVSRQISALKRDNVVVLSGTRDICVPDYSRLLQEAGDDSDGGYLD